jgi:DNA mismatch endonuclease Vsr
MSLIRSTGTKIEVFFGKRLWARGLRYRKNDKFVIGKPDFSFRGVKVAVFCDSEFWHGRNWKRAKLRFSGNREYWVSKIERNIKRDRKVNRILSKSGWQVIRFWAEEIRKNPDACADLVKRAVDERKAFHT